MKHRIAISVLAGSVLVGLIALGTGRTVAQPDARPSKEDPRSPKAEKIESSRDLAFRPAREEARAAVESQIRSAMADRMNIALGEGAYVGTGSLLRTSEGQWTFEFGGSARAVTFEPVVEFEAGELPMDQAFQGRVHLQALGPIVLATLTQRDSGLVYEAALTLETDDARNVLQALHAAAAEGLVPNEDSAVEVSATQNAPGPAEMTQLKGGLVRGEPGDPVVVPNTFDVEPVAPPGGTCTCGAGRCSASCPGGKLAECVCGMFTDTCRCVMAPA